ncbi:MAG: hypothetical protein HY244_11755 [Rhizobiales bacterium]|nr:hypothetical protein [Hyphomicrobiales bacterium]
MLRTLAAAAVAVSLIAGPVLAQGPAAGTSAPTTTSQPAKADARKTVTIEHVKKHHVGKKHAVKVVKHVKHKKHFKHVKRVKHPTEKTRG